MKLKISLAVTTVFLLAIFFGFRRHSPGGRPFADGHAGDAYRARFLRHAGRHAAIPARTFME